MNHILLPTIVASLLAMAFQARAQSVPALINYQGQLTQPNGLPLPTADCTLTFRIFDTASGSNAIWGPQVFDGQAGPGHGPKIPVVQGFFNVMLGPVDTFGTSITTAFSGINRFVEIKIGTNNPIAPRQQILSAPFAIKAGDSGKLAGYDWSSLLNVNDPVNGKIQGSKIATETITSTQIADSGINSGRLQDGVITTTKISDGAVGSSKIANGSIGLNHLTAAVTNTLSPPGTVVAFAGATAPVGWLLCDGFAVSRSQYASLYSAIGTAWGTGDGINTFNKPDLRGVFLRGVNGARSDQFADPGDNRTTGNVVGSFQPDAFQGHWHDLWGDNDSGGSLNVGFRPFGVKLQKSIAPLMLGMFGLP